jgi:transcription antitermination factor NusG
MAWYCIITNPNCQRRAEAELASKGYRVFWPRQRKWATHARTKVAKEYPLIWRYVFVEIGAEQSFGEVRSVNGVERFVGDLGRPGVIDSRDVEEFMHRYMRGEWDFVTTEPCPYWDAEAGEEKIRINRNTFPKGARVRVMEGEFADLLATVLGRKSGKLRLVPRGNHRMIETWPANVRAA